MQLFFHSRHYFLLVQPKYQDYIYLLKTLNADVYSFHIVSVIHIITPQHVLRVKKYQIIQKIKVYIS